MDFPFLKSLVLQVLLPSLLLHFDANFRFELLFFSQFITAEVQVIDVDSSSLLDTSSWCLVICIPPSTTSVEFHKFYDVLFSLALNNKYFLHFLLISLLTCRCLHVLLSFQIFEYFPEIFRTTILDLIPYEQRTYFVCDLNNFKLPEAFVLQCRIYSIFVNVLRVLKEVYVSFCGVQCSLNVNQVKWGSDVIKVFYIPIDCYLFEVSIIGRERYGNLCPCVHVSILLTILSDFA